MLVLPLKSIVMFLTLLLAVGFYTLLERKVLSYIQIRKGPNKVGIMGLVQPLADAAKLFVKEYSNVFHANKKIFLLSPLLAMLIMLMIWFLYGSSYGLGNFSLGILFFLAVSSLNVYSILMSGWSSNSKYALLGSVRAIAQTISYEVSMALMLMCVLLLTYTFNLMDIPTFKGGFTLLVVTFPIFVMWLVSALAETNRAPFDLAEGESELVSGYNVEYGGAEFAFLFIAEYGSILFMSLATSLLFLGGKLSGLGLDIFKLSAVSIIFLWVRGTYPRMRYDNLMSLTWKVFLSVTLTLGMLLCLFWTENELKKI